MAAMAPALTDAPAEARHIRFKLAPPSSTLSPPSPSAANNATNALLSNGKEAELQLPQAPPPAAAHAAGAHLGKLQPLVASYLCSDVTSVPATKESLKLQGVLIKGKTVLTTHGGVLPDSYFLHRKPRPPALELSGEQLRSVMSGSGRGGGAPPTAPPSINGLAKKLAKRGSNSDFTASVNGDSPTASKDAPPPQHQAPPPQNQTPPPGAERGVLLKGGAEHRLENLQGVGGQPIDGQEQPMSTVDVATDAGGGDSDCSAPVPAPSSSSVDAEVRERAQSSRTRQGEIEGRLRRLRRRLQVVQAKQVERHVAQQLRSLLQSAACPLPPSPMQAPPSPGAFLRSGSVPAQLERLSLSGATNLRSAECAFDSDATESSSGGESDAEEEELARAQPEKRHVSLWRRAEGRYAMERASIISHWNWLQAHISDLEYRIRQQSDIYRQIRSNKGLIVLGDSAPCESSVEDRVEVKAESVPCQVTQEHGVGGAERTDTEMGLWKGWGPGRPVNGVLNSLLPSCSPDGSGADDQLGKKLLATPSSSSSSLPSSSFPSDASCTAARTRAVLNCKRRRLVRPNAVTNLNRKAQRLPAPRCSCEVNPSCLMCSGRPTSLTGDLPYERPLLDRLSCIDPCIHPILSFKDDVAMTQHLQGALKTHWQSRPLEKSKPQKKFSLKQKLSGRLSDPSSSYPPSSRDKHRLPNSLITTIRLSHHNKLRLQQRQPFDSLLSASKLRKDRSRALSRGPHDRPHSRKRPRDSSLDRAEPSKLYADSCSPCSSTSLHTPIHSPLLRQLSTSSESSMPFSLSGQNAISTPQPIRRRRGESSFDINNIVIPMSVAATTRVEKLQYKEILTPSWREVNICARPISKEDDAREVEDLSDVTFAEIHQMCEDQERARWSWTASAMAKRRGSRSYKSLDGRSTPLLGGTNPPTPQPSSPDPGQFPLLQDYGPVASPCSPASPDLLPPHHHRLSISEDTRCSTPEGGYEELIPQPVQPWETRTFPLDYDPLTEPQEPPCPPAERLGHAPRRVSVSKPDPAPASPDSAPIPSPEEGPRQKPPLFLLRSTLQ